MNSTDNILINLYSSSPASVQQTVPVRDRKILVSLFRQISSGHFLTENQGKLLVKIFNENIDNLEFKDPEILSLIESPSSDPAGLEYKDTNDFDALRDYPEKVKLYNLNTFYYWKGDHFHRMKKFGMNDGESRITLQGHYVLKDNRAYIYW